MIDNVPMDKQKFPCHLQAATLKVNILLSSNQSVTVPKILNDTDTDTFFGTKFFDTDSGTFFST